MINLILTEDEALLLFGYFSVGISNRNCDMLSMIRDSEAVSYLENKFGIEVAESLVEKMNIMYKNVPCDNPNCETHHPKENANPNLSRTE